MINVGRLEEQKDHRTLIKAINFIKDKINIKLLIIGNGKLQNKLDQFIKTNKLERNIKILNNITNPYPYIKIRFILFYHHYMKVCLMFY